MKKTSCDREKSYWRRVGVVCFSLILVLTSWVNVQAAGLRTDLPKIQQKAGYSSTGAMDVFGKLVGIALGFMGVVVLVIVLLGGFKWITSGGAEEKIKDAQKLIAAGAVGLLIIASAYAISSFITSKVVDTGGVAKYSSAECDSTNIGESCYYDEDDKVTGSCGKITSTPDYGCVIPISSCTADRSSISCYPTTGFIKANVYSNQCTGDGEGATDCA